MDGYGSTQRQKRSSPNHSLGGHERLYSLAIRLSHYKERSRFTRHIRGGNRLPHQSRAAIAVTMCGSRLLRKKHLHQSLHLPNRPLSRSRPPPRNRPPPRSRPLPRNRPLPPSRITRTLRRKEHLTNSSQIGHETLARLPNRSWQTTVTMSRHQRPIAQVAIGVPLKRLHITRKLRRLPSEQAFLKINSRQVQNRATKVAGEAKVQRT